LKWNKVKSVKEEEEEEEEKEEKEKEGGRLWSSSTPML